LEYADAMTQTPVEVRNALFVKLCEKFTDGQLVELTATLAWENYAHVLTMPSAWSRRALRRAATVPCLRIREIKLKASKPKNGHEVFLGTRCNSHIQQHGFRRSSVGYGSFTSSTVPIRWNFLQPDTSCPQGLPVSP
jgi:hypothetical protein